MQTDEIFRKILLNGVTKELTVKSDKLGISILEADYKNSVIILQRIENDFRIYENIFRQYNLQTFSQITKIDNNIVNNNVNNMIKQFIELICNSPIKDILLKNLIQIYDLNITKSKLEMEIDKCKQLKLLLKNEFNTNILHKLNDRDIEINENNQKALSRNIQVYEMKLKQVQETHDIKKAELSRFLCMNYDGKIIIVNKQPFIINENHINILCKYIFYDSLYLFYTSILNDCINKKLLYNIAVNKNENDNELILFEKLNNRYAKKYNKHTYFKNISDEEYEKSLKTFMQNYHNCET